MGKRYHCDYCDKTMVSTPAIVKTHNKGLVHQKLVQQHYRQFKDPETILAEEQGKRPCSRFSSGSCQFDGICRFSHYTQDELNVMREYVSKKQRREADILQPSFQELYQKLQKQKTDLPQAELSTTIMFDNLGVTHEFPWKYNSDFDSIGDKLPPSLKRFKIEDFEHANITEWG